MLVGMNVAHSSCEGRTQLVCKKEQHVANSYGKFVWS